MAPVPEAGNQGRRYFTVAIFRMRGWAVGARALREQGIRGHVRDLGADLMTIAAKAGMPPLLAKPST